MRITKKLLKKKGACREGIRWFVERFPKGGTLEELLQSEAARECPTEFVWWVYENIVQDERLLALCGVCASSGVYRSDDVYGSDGVCGSDSVYMSAGVHGSTGVYMSFGVHRSFGCSVCQGISWCLFCADATGKYLIFNCQTEEQRYYDVWDRLLDRLGDWRPSFYDGRNGILSIQEAWSGMPEAAVEYVISLPEFDAELFQRITGIAV